MAAMQYLDSLRNSHPELSDWYNTLADLYQRKLWHQLTLKLEQFVALAVFQAGDALIQLYHNFITDFETKINLLKLAHFAVIVSRQYSEKEAAISYLEGVIEKLRATREMRIEEPVLYIKMQIAMFNLEKGDQKECKKLLEDGKSTLDSMTDIDPSVHASYYWISSQYHKSRQEFAEFYKSALLYLAYTSLLEAAEYARKKGVVLKGDLPIGVDRNSVDTGVHPSLFRMNTSTGAPPDYFDKNGQNWGFPAYNWDEMSKDNYAWWHARLTQMGKYFTAYRIDHILGFFRIWELPDHAMTGLVGKFRPSIPLSQEELEKEGICDFDRLSHPYILQKTLKEIFGPSWTVIAANFMNEYQKNRYEFKEDCNTEKKIASILKSGVEKSLFLESEDELRRGLFDLLQNIVLIRDPEDPKKFYPRFNLEDTSSFKDLDEHSKNVLKRLYYDYYFHRQESLWRQNALKTLPALLNSSDMLACGEDLGLIPSCVHPVMQELGLIGLRIQRMPSEPGLEFAIPSQYGYMTVCAPSCHDCSTLRAWWEEDEERRCKFFKIMMGSDKLPPSQCVPEIAYFVLRQHVEAPSMWAIFPLQDLLALKVEYTARPAVEETINDPTNPKHYWRFRVHVTLESLLKDKELTKTIKDLVRGSGRSYPPTGKVEGQDACVISEKQQIGGGQDKLPLANQLNGVCETKSIAVL